ncbi:hypothetical protein NX801_19905 [Streptomyces sp. LP05-1]|uniref:Integral membrane protein n=1 Tax=Streptomyces pyxinae TaxID=2970734 RepID=A0ABT2CKD8_9ACTN|nr:hypothetical protein [Streptomyces sp. LP05-1]MCS0637883.1 hypothetical protein [Streptomyces sp. LP05-1]
MEAPDTTDLREDLDATLRARRELGTEYESALIESFLEKVEERIDTAIDRRVRRQAAEQRLLTARGGRPAHPDGENFGRRFGFAVAMMILAVPLTAIAVVQAGLPGLIVTWLGIAAVNGAHACRGVLPFRSRGDEKSG